LYQKYLKMWAIAEIEKSITVVSITNTLKDRKEIARAFIAKNVYNLQTTRDLLLPTTEHFEYCVVGDTKTIFRVNLNLAEFHKN